MANAPVPPVLVTRTIATTAPLSGGGDLSGDRTLAIIGGSSGQVLTSNGQGNAPTFQSPTGGTQTLAQVLVQGNTTGGTNLVISTGDSLVGSATTFVGNGTTSATPTNGTIKGTASSAGGTVGGSVILQGGDPPDASTGSGAVDISTTPNNTVPFAARFRVDANANVIVNPAGGALTTNATDAFLYIPSCAGVPSGTPSVLPTGAVPVVVNTTNNRFMAYYGGAWHSLSP